MYRLCGTTPGRLWAVLSQYAADASRSGRVGAMPRSTFTRMPLWSMWLPVPWGHTLDHDVGTLDLLRLPLVFTQSSLLDPVGLCRGRLRAVAWNCESNICRSCTDGACSFLSSNCCSRPSRRSGPTIDGLPETQPHQRTNRGSDHGGT